MIESRVGSYFYLLGVLFVAFLTVLILLVAHLSAARFHWTKVEQAAYVCFGLCVPFLGGITIFYLFYLFIMILISWG